jgi:hypothetical protein
MEAPLPDRHSGRNRLKERALKLRLSAAAAVAACCTVAFVAPSIASAAQPVSAASSSAVAQTATPASQASAITNAEAFGGGLVLYHPSTNTWTAVTTGAESSSAALSSTGAESVDAAATWTPSKACLVWLTFTIALCNNTATTYDNVLPQQPAAIVKSLETVDTEDFDDALEGSEAFKRADDVLEGNNDEASNDVVGGYSNGSAGAEDEAIDFGSEVVDVLTDIDLFAF